MAAQYLLPCECGAETPIDTNQAGGSVVCTCGQRLEVPSLRAIRQLARHDEGSEVGKYEWNPAAGMIFVSGVFLALIGGAVAVVMHFNATYAADFEGPPEDEVQAWVSAIDTAPPEELFDTWNASRHVGLGDHENSPFVQARAISAQFAMYRNVAVIVVVSGLLFAGTSVLVRRKEVK